MNKENSKGGITLRVEWGYESHESKVSQAEWEEICSGKKVVLNGPGYYYEGEHFQDTWVFNSHPVHTLIVEYGEDGAQGFVGRIEDAISG
jgi:hypothetical protein